MGNSDLRQARIFPVKQAKNHSEAGSSEDPARSCLGGGGGGFACRLPWEMSRSHQAPVLAHDRASPTSHLCAGPSQVNTALHRLGSHWGHGEVFAAVVTDPVPSLPLGSPKRPSSGDGGSLGSATTTGTPLRSSTAPLSVEPPASTGCPSLSLLEVAVQLLHFVRERGHF